MSILKWIDDRAKELAGTVGRLAGEAENTIRGIDPGNEWDKVKADDLRQIREMAQREGIKFSKSDNYNTLLRKIEIGRKRAKEAAADKREKLLTLEARRRARALGVKFSNSDDSSAINRRIEAQRQKARDEQKDLRSTVNKLATKERARAIRESDKRQKEEKRRNDQIQRERDRQQRRLDREKASQERELKRRQREAKRRNSRDSQKTT